MEESSKQLLMALRELESFAGRFGRFKEDWSCALESLVKQGFIMADNPYCLTEQGQELSDEIKRQQPPMWYWYRDFYLACSDSAAHAIFCERLYGKNLCQHGFADIAQLRKLLEVLDLNEGDVVLDIGCGNGLISEYIFDHAKAHVYGIDYVPEAIAQAKARTGDKQSLLTFEEGNLDEIGYPADSFDGIVSIDSMYMATDLTATIGQMASALKPSGRMAFYYSHVAGDASDDGLRSLLPENTPLGLALKANGLEFKTWDYTESDYAHAKLKKELAEELRDEFEQEGNLFLYKNRAGEAKGVMGDIESGLSVRYLYLANMGAD